MTAPPGRWNSPSHDLKQNLVTAVTIAAELEERYMDAIFNALISEYGLAVQTVEQLLPKGPQHYEYWLGVVSGYEGSIGIFTRLYRIPDHYLEKANRAQVEAERLRKLVRPERLQARMGDPPDGQVSPTAAVHKG